MTRVLLAEPVVRFSQKRILQKQRNSRHLVAEMHCSNERWAIEATSFAYD